MYSAVVLNLTLALSDGDSASSGACVMAREMPLMPSVLQASERTYTLMLFSFKAGRISSTAPQSSEGTHTRHQVNCTSKKKILRVNKDRVWETAEKLFQAYTINSRTIGIFLHEQERECNLHYRCNYLLWTWINCWKRQYRFLGSAMISAKACTQLIRITSPAMSNTFWIPL